GKKRSKRESLGTDRDLAIAELARRCSLKTGVTVEPVEKLSVEEAARRWLSTYVATNRSGASLQKLAAQRVRDYLNPLLGHLLLGRVTRNDVRKYRLAVESSVFEEDDGHRERRRTRPLSPQTVRHILSDLRCLLNWCVESEFIERSPFPQE